MTLQIPMMGSHLPVEAVFPACAYMVLSKSSIRAIEIGSSAGFSWQAYKQQIPASGSIV